MEHSESKLHLYKTEANISVNFLCQKMSRTKLRKFAEIKASPIVFDPEKIRGKSWQKDIFKNSNPIHLELACGKGKFSIQMAQNHPELNFIAIDRKGERIWHAAQNAQNLGLSNLVFFQGNINYIEKEFKTNEIDELWITFPDPFPKDKNARQRLTHLRFLEKYKVFLKNSGTFNLKTDFKLLLEFTEQEILKLGGKILQKETDIYSKRQTLPEYLFYQTDFELKHLNDGKQIHYLKAILNCQT